MSIQINKRIDDNFTILTFVIPLYVFLAPILVVPTPIGFLGATEILSILGVLALLSHGSIRLSSVAVIYIIFLTYFVFINIFLAIITPVNSDVFLVLRLVTSFLPFLLFDQITDCSKKQLNSYSKLFLQGLSLAVIAGLLMFAFGIELRDGQQRLWYDGGSMARAGGLTANSGGFGYVSALFICYLWINRSLSEKKLNSFFFFILISLGISAVALSSSRAAFLFLIVMFSVLMLVKIITFDRSLIKIFFKSLIFLGLATWVLSFGFDANNELTFFIFRSLERLDVLNISGQDAFLKTARFDNWPIVAEEIKKNIFLGIGYKQFFSNFQIYSDNSFIGIAIDGGILSLVLYAFFWIAVLLDAVFKMFTVSELYKYLVAFLMGSLAFAVTVDFYSMWYPTALFFMAYAILRITIHQKVVFLSK